MDKEQVKVLLGKIEKYIPVSVIEKHLNMPVNTLQKVLSDTEKQKRNLPKKWVKPLSDFVNFKRWITMDYFKPKVKLNDLNNKDDLVPPKQPKSNFTIDTTERKPYMSKEMIKKLYG